MTKSVFHQSSILSAPQVTHQVNEQLKSKLARMIFANHELPGAGGKTKITGEEHINAILYQYLIEEKKRSDVVILPLIGRSLFVWVFNHESPHF